jgi:iron(III) transport system substrate-binding protein
MDVGWHCRNLLVQERRISVIPVFILVIVLLTIVTACAGGQPDADIDTSIGDLEDDDTASDTFSQQAEESLAALQAVMAEVEGMDLEARRERLTQLALDEIASGEPLNLYTGFSDAIEILDALYEETGVTVGMVSAGGDDATATRLMTEAEAGFEGADVVVIAAQWVEGPGGLDSLGLLHPLETPYRDEIVEIGQGDTWLAAYVNVKIPVWNTDLVDDPPDSWVDMLENHAQDPDIGMAIEIQDAQWGANLVQILQEYEGLSEDEAMDLLLTAATGNPFQRGSTVGLTFTAAGQYAIHSQVNHHGLDEFLAEGAPLGWEPSPEPVIVYTNGPSIVANTTNPAGALLLLEYIVSTDGQEILRDFGRTPSNTNVDGGFPFDKYETWHYDYSLLQDSTKWDAFWAEVVAKGRDDRR